MGSTLDANCVILAARWPAVWEWIMAASLPQPVEIVGQPPVSLIIDGIHLSSLYDRQQEARQQAALVPADSSTAWVYGPGMGDLPRQLLGRPTLEHLTAVILNPGVFRLSLSYFDQTDWLADERVSLVLAESQEEVRFPLAANPACLRLADDRAARLRDLVLLELATPFIQSHFAENQTRQQNLAESVAFLETDGDVRQLFGAHPGSRILVAASGPTLEDHFGWLRHKENVLIAVDMSLKPLAQAGVLADLVVTIDPKTHSRSIFDFDLSPFEQTPLVYFPDVFAAALRAWPGPRFGAYVENHNRHDELARRFSRGRLFSSGSVFHSAVDLAVKMGAQQVVFLGADFAYPRGVSHASGAVDRQPVVHNAADWVLDGYGQRVQTRTDLRGFLRETERYIQAHPQVEFINASRSGAAIRGAAYREHSLP